MAEKLGVKAGTKAFMAGAPEGFVSEMSASGIEISDVLSGGFSYIHLFVTSQKTMDAEFPKFKKHLSAKGSLWLSWPKARQCNTDLTLPIVIKKGYDHGLVESKTISIDSTWSAIKFTHPIKGKVYKNSFGKLKI